jgi:uncharacterized protein YdeI (YjbR/CyaY-like superfamily)
LEQTIELNRSRRSPVGSLCERSREVDWTVSLVDGLTRKEQVRIDGVRKRIDEASYKIRFTPRKRGSVWSSVNIRRCQVLAEQGRMRPAGLKAFEARRANKSGIYAYEQRRDQLEEPYQSILKRNKAAWEFYQAQPPGYRKTLGWWVVSAKKEETRLKRLKQLIEDSARGKRL